MSRYPLRTAASIIGGLTSLVSGLVGSGLLTTDQGNAATGLITAVVTALAAFGVVIFTEQKVTPLAAPRNRQGEPLEAAETAAEGRSGAPEGQETGPA